MVSTAFVPAATELVLTAVPPETLLVVFLYQVMLSETPETAPAPVWQVLKVNCSGLADAPWQ